MNDNGKLPRVCWILEASTLAGGVKVIFEYANHLASMGYPVSIYSLGAKPDWFRLHKNVEWLSFGGYEILLKAAITQAHEVVIATWWKTAYIVKDIIDQTHQRGLYLIQDIETAYYVDPIHRQAVTDTYAMGLEHFTTSRWVEKQLPTCTYTGIAIGRWRNVVEGGARRREALACLRRQALKGFRELTETCRYLGARQIPLFTFGVDSGVRVAVNHEHNLPLGADVNSDWKSRASLNDHQIQKRYSLCGAFISTSLHEGLSMTPLEAMACGSPVIMFPADGNMEYAVDGGNCLLAQSPLDMADKVEMLLKNKDLAAKLSKSGLATAQHYAIWQGPVSRLIALIGT